MAKKFYVIASDPYTNNNYEWIEKWELEDEKDAIETAEYLANELANWNKTEIMRPFLKEESEKLKAEGYSDEEILEDAKRKSTNVAYSAVAVEIDEEDDVSDDKVILRAPRETLKTFYVQADEYVEYGENGEEIRYIE